MGCEICRACGSFHYLWACAGGDWESSTESWDRATQQEMVCSLLKLKYCLLIGCWITSQWSQVPLIYLKANYSYLWARERHVPIRWGRLEMRKGMQLSEGTVPESCHHLHKHGLRAVGGSLPVSGNLPSWARKICVYVTPHNKMLLLWVCFLL